MKQIKVSNSQSPALSSKTIIEEINQLNGEIMGAVRTNLDKAIRIGGLLTQIKSDLDHGEWLPWLKANVQFSQQTASIYVRCFERREEIKLLNLSNLTEAQRFLAPPSTPPPPPQRRIESKSTDALSPCSHEEACEITALAAFIIWNRRGQPPTVEEQAICILKLMLGGAAPKFEFEEEGTVRAFDENRIMDDVVAA